MSSERLNKTAVKDARLKDLLLERGTGASAGTGTAGCGPGLRTAGSARRQSCGIRVRGEARGDGLVWLLVGLSIMSLFSSSSGKVI